MSRQQQRVRKHGDFLVRLRTREALAKVIRELATLEHRRPAEMIIRLAEEGLKARGFPLDKGIRS